MIHIQFLKKRRTVEFKWTDNTLKQETGMSKKNKTNQDYT